MSFSGIILGLINIAIATVILLLVGVIIVRVMSMLKHIEASAPDLWRDYRSALDKYEQALGGLSYSNLQDATRVGLDPSGLLTIELPSPSAPSSPYGLPSGSLPLSQIETLLHIGDKPHGYELIEPAMLPVGPPLSPLPPPLWQRILWGSPKSNLSVVERQSQVERASKLKGECEALRQRWDELKQGCKAGEPEAIKTLMKVANWAHPLLQVLQSDLTGC